MGSCYRISLWCTMCLFWKAPAIHWVSNVWTLFWVAVCFSPWFGCLAVCFHQGTRYSMEFYTWNRCTDSAVAEGNPGKEASTEAGGTPVPGMDEHESFHTFQPPRWCPSPVQSLDFPRHDVLSSNFTMWRHKANEASSSRICASVCFF